MIACRRHKCNEWFQIWKSVFMSLLTLWCYSVIHTIGGCINLNFSAFFSYTFLTAYTPGPNNIMSMTNASRDGLKRTLPFLAGIITGFIVVMAACAAFSSLLYEFIPSIRPVMLCIGAAYILWLAWMVWRDKSGEGKSGITHGNSFSSGMLLQFVNMKIILYGITAMSSYVLPHYHDVATVALFTLLLSAIGTSGCLCWSLFGAIFEKLFKKYRKALNVIMALLLVYCAVSLFLWLRPLKCTSADIIFTNEGQRIFHWITSYLSLIIFAI